MPLSHSLPYFYLGLSTFPVLRAAGSPPLLQCPDFPPASMPSRQLDEQVLTDVPMEQGRQDLLGPLGIQCMLTAGGPFRPKFFKYPLSVI